MTPTPAVSSAGPGAPDPRPWLLVFDTAAEACSAALARLDDPPGAAPRHRFALAARGHGERLPAMVDDLLIEAGIDPDALGAVACGIGPGAFAGVRIGTGFAQGLALAMEIPVVGVVSLAMMAARLVAEGHARAWCALDARMGEVYVAAYERGPGGLPVEVSPPTVARPENALLPPAGWAGAGWAAGGPGFAAHPELLARATAVHGAPAALVADLLPDARFAIELARQALAAPGLHGPENLRPVYLRNHVALTIEEQIRARQAKN